MEHDVIDRFLRLLEELGYHTQQQIADMLGVSRPKAGTIKRRVQPPALEDVVKLGSLHSEINLDWILTGRGTRYITGDSIPKKVEPLLPPAPATSDLELVAHLKDQLDRWQEEAETWKELYLQQIGRPELLGKLPGSLDAAPLTYLTYTVTRRRVGFTPGFLALEEIREVSADQASMWVVQEAGYATEQEAQEAA